MTNEDEELLADLLMRWEEDLENGREIPPTELCKDHPHLTLELGRRIEALKATSWLDKPIIDNGPTFGGESSGDPRTLNGRYRLEKLIAVGGFAQVWRGFDLELQRTIAVKFPRPSRLESKETFLAEARRVARLKHPGIVPVHDVGHDGDSCFIVSEFIEGGSLGDQLAKHPPSQRQAIQWIIDIADALEYAHLHGVIHQDIKPANILINHLNRALLADFGIAHSSKKSGDFAPSLGTLRYMPPEQLEGRDTDSRADIFSLGIVLHEALTGKLPYSSDVPNALLKEIVAGTAGKATLAIPNELKRICQKALQRNPMNRYLSANHFAGDLRRVLNQPRTARGLLPALTLLVVVIALVGISVTTWRPKQPKSRTDTRPVHTLAFQVETGNETPLPKDAVSTSTGMKFVLVPAGEFQMGSPETEPGRKSYEGPQHTVRLTRPFHLGVYEVTQGEYEQVMGVNPTSKRPLAGKNAMRCPVDNVTWFDAIDFCNRLSERDGLPEYYKLTDVSRVKLQNTGILAIASATVTTLGGPGYRLPTEAEWEYACRAGTTTPFHFGNSLNGTEANAEGSVPYGTTNPGPSLKSTVDVGSYPGNAFGLFDMHGNSWEWCEDNYDVDAYSKRTGIVSDPVVTVESPLRSLRGGASPIHPRDVRSAFRYGIAPVNFDGNCIGFRVAKFVPKDEGRPTQ